MDPDVAPISGASSPLELFVLRKLDEPMILPKVVPLPSEVASRIEQQ
jgi:hypothetical protein